MKTRKFVTRKAAQAAATIALTWLFLAIMWPSARPLIEPVLTGSLTAKPLLNTAILAIVAFIVIRQIWSATGHIAEWTSKRANSEAAQ